MSARIARGSAVNTRQSARRGQPVRRGNARKKAPTLAERLPIPTELAGRLVRWGAAGMLAATLVALLLVFRVPQLTGEALGNAVGGAGFEVKHVEVRGLKRMQDLPVYAVAFDQESVAMPLVDLDGTRERLLQFGWIKEARVSRRLPDTLVVDVVERAPAAVWQMDGRLQLIDAEGVVLEGVALDSLPDLPLVIGPAANLHVGALGQLLEAVPHLKPQVEGASWVGTRRWDIRFQTGEVLALPEGVDAARRALLNFARIDQQTQVLGRGFARFDMRIPGRFIVRVTRAPGQTVPAADPEAATGTAEDLSRTI